jgi:hypothetical protein
VLKFSNDALLYNGGICAASSSRSGRALIAQSHRSTPLNPPLSTVRHPVPPHIAHTAWACSGIAKT